MEIQPTRPRFWAGVCAILALAGLSLLPSTGQRGVAGEYEIAAAPTDPMFVKYDGVDGESPDKAHKGWSDILSFSQAHEAGESGAGSALRLATCVFEDLVVVKEIDKSSPKLAEAVCKGKVFPKVEIHAARPAGGVDQVYLRYELTNVRISRYHLSGSSLSDALPTEEISLSFEEIKMTYTEYDDAGRLKGNVEYSWKITEMLRLQGL